MALYTTGGVSVKPCSLYDYLSKIKGVVREYASDRQWIVAEIAKVSNSWPQGHCYLELIQTDEDGSTIAEARGIIWRNVNNILTPYFKERAGSDLQEGTRVMAEVQANFSEKFGLSLIISDIDPSYTLGVLEAKKRETLLRLEREGLLDLNKELAIPALPSRIAVVSSDTAAGYGDFMKHLSESEFGFKVELFAAPMQGVEAPQGIYDAFQAVALREREFDIVVLIRGGGSASDLLCFNDYLVAKAIAECPLPVICGVGHERDTHICDMVAAVRVKTPTGAADFIIGMFQEAAALVEQLEQRMNEAVRNKINDGFLWLVGCVGRMRARVDALTIAEQARLNLSSQRMYNAAFQRIMAAAGKVELLQARLKGADPSSILAQGYAMVYANGLSAAEPSFSKVMSIKQIQEGSTLRIAMRDGSIEFTVKDIKR